MGSSPLTRRIQYYNAHTPLGQRFIPAHAGNTRESRAIVSDQRVHPRSRGEYSPCFFWRCILPGSSPLTRGIPAARHFQAADYRFTPAHAGNTWKVGRWNKPGLVHPRSRGEYLPLIRWRAREIGSPPLTRGIHFSGSPGSKRHRFTPAHAGNTFAVMQKKALR